MILMQPKKVANLIIGSKKPDYVDSIGETKVSMSPEVEEDNSIGLEAASSAIISAVEAKDSQKLMLALKNFMYLCEESEEEAE
jgi:hypothetical protein